MAILAAGCRRPSPSPTLTDPPRAEGTAVPSDGQQGLSGAEVAAFYHLDEGGELYPLALFLALETEDGAPFAGTLQRYGFLPDPHGPHGLPVGLTVSDGVDGLAMTPMIGITCAACHVGELTYGGRAVRIVGGPSLVHQKAFFDALFAATERALRRPDTVVALARSALRDRKLAERLRVRLPLAHAILTRCSSWQRLRAAGPFGRALVARIERLHALEAADVDPAASRFAEDPRAPAGTREPVDVGDLSGMAAADDGGAELGAACPLEDPAARDAAVTQLATHLVETQRLLEGRREFLRRIVGVAHGSVTPFGPGRADDWNVARAQLFDPRWALPLNSPLSFPPIWGLDDIPWLHYDNDTNSIMQRNFGQAFATGAPFELTTFGSTVDPRKLRRAADLAAKIEPPTWPEEILGPVDAARAARGRTLFAARCAACHEGETPGSAPGDKRYDRDLIGTDTNRLTSFETPIDGRPFSERFPPVLGGFIDWSMAHAGIGPAEAAELLGPAPEWRTTGQWGTRSLRGAWATAPYLHNGSVPTIHDLLRPAAERPVRFPIGSRVYDPVKLGYVTEDVDGWIFDTTVSGNANTGHEGPAFGTDLAEPDRMALIEFLKNY